MSNQVPHISHINKNDLINHLFKDIPHSITLKLMLLDNEGNGEVTTMARVIAIEENRLLPTGRIVYFDIKAPVIVNGEKEMTHNLIQMVCNLSILFRQLACIDSDDITDINDIEVTTKKLVSSEEEVFKPLYSKLLEGVEIVPRSELTCMLKVQ